MEMRLLLALLISLFMVGCGGGSGGGESTSQPDQTNNTTQDNTTVTATVVNDVVAENNTDLIVTYNAAYSWADGFQSELIITNHSTVTTSSWKLNFDLSANIDNLWGGTISSSSNGHYEVLPVSWNKALPPGGSTTVGFSATGMDDIRNIVLIDPIAAITVPSNNPDFTMTYRTLNGWPEGFQGEVILNNNSQVSISNWTLAFELPANIEQIWDATITSHSGNAYQLAPVSWTTTIPAGSSITLGFTTTGENGMTQISLVDPAYDTTPVVEPTPTEPAPTAPAPTDPAPTDPVVSEPAPTAAPITITTPVAYSGTGPSLTNSYNYGKALQMAWYFYEAQRSGPLPKFDGDLPFFDPDTNIQLHNGYKANRIPWRGDSDLEDGADVGVDLTGGWHDAGDHVKFGLPMAFSATTLAWGVLEFKDALTQTNQLVWAKDNLRWVADYLVRAHVAPNVLYGQVGAGQVDHTIWGAPEVMPHYRPAWKIDMNNPGPDLAAQTSAALTTISMVFRADEPEYAAVLLKHAIELYEFAQATRDDSVEHLGRYSDSITDAQSFYASRAGAKDDIPFAAAWLYVATKEAKYLHDAEADYVKISDRTGHKGWTFVWDDVRYGVYMLMSKIYSDPDYARDSLITSNERHDGYYDYNLHAQNFLNHWANVDGISHTPAGMAYLAAWGSARYTTVTGFLAMIYRKHLKAQGVGQQLQDNYLKFATEQMNYVLGDNPLNMSYMVGFGDNYSQYAHHRAAHGSTTNNINFPEIPRHVLFGGLAGGPSSSDTYTTDRSVFAMTEVATDMNAGMNGLLAALVDAYGIAGNETDPNFPPAGPEYRELYVKALLKTQQPASLATEVVVTVVNESAYPPRDSDGYKFRYYVNLKELFDLGYTLDDVVLDTYWDEGAGVTLNRLGDSAYIFYVEGSFVGTNITPLGNDKKQKHIQFIIRLPWVDRGWDGSNDPSFQDLIGGTNVVTDKITLYDTNLPIGEQLIWGVEPDPGISQSELPPPSTDPVATDPVLSSSFSTSINVYSLWNTGHCARFVLTNTGDTAAKPKAIQFILPADVNITNSWNGDITRTGDTVDVALFDTLGFIQPGESRSDFGYCADSPTTPYLPGDAPVATDPVTTTDPAPAPTEPVAPSFSVSINVYSSWATGFCSKFTVTNDGTVAAVPPGYTVVLPTDVIITNSWNGTYTRNGDLMDVTLPGYVGEMQPGASRTDFGFCANGTTLPVMQ